MNLIYVTQHFFPETGACSFRTTDLATFFNDYMNVSVLTSIPNYPFRRVYDGYKNENMVENYNGCKVYRAKIKNKSKKEKVDRILNYLYFWRNSLKISKQIEKSDIVLGTIGPIFVADIAYKISKRNNSPFVLEIRDLTYKQILGTNYGSSNIAKIVKKYEISYAKKAHLIITVTDGYRKDLIENGVNPEKIRVIKNGFNFRKLESTNDIKEDLFKTIQDKLKPFKVRFGYFGTLGVSQNVLEVVKELKKIRESAFLIFGEGAQYNDIEKYIKAENINNIFLYPSIKETELKAFYSLVDYNLVILKNSPEFSYTIPSKIFEIMGYKAIPVFIGPEGEAADIIKEIDPRLHIKELGELNYLFALNQTEKDKLKENAHEICYRNYNREKQANEYIKVLEDFLEKYREKSH
jgi:glycosyltransferase involved in cell wall biosynthesis